MLALSLADKIQVVELRDLIRSVHSYEHLAPMLCFILNNINDPFRQTIYADEVFTLFSELRSMDPNFVFSKHGIRKLDRIDIEKIQSNICKTISIPKHVHSRGALDLILSVTCKEIDGSYFVPSTMFDYKKDYYDTSLSNIFFDLNISDLLKKRLIECIVQYFDCISTCKTPSEATSSETEETDSKNNDAKKLIVNVSPYIDTMLLPVIFLGVLSELESLGIEIEFRRSAFNSDPRLNATLSVGYALNSDIENYPTSQHVSVSSVRSESIPFPVVINHLGLEKNVDSVNIINFQGNFIPSGGLRILLTNCGQDISSDICKNEFNSIYFRTSDQRDSVSITTTSPASSHFAQSSVKAFENIISLFVLANSKTQVGIIPTMDNFLLLRQNGLLTSSSAACFSEFANFSNSHSFELELTEELKGKLSLNLFVDNSFIHNKELPQFFNDKIKVSSSRILESIENIVKDCKRFILENSRSNRRGSFHRFANVFRFSVDYFIEHKIFRPNERYIVSLDDFNIINILSTCPTYLEFDQEWERFLKNWLANHVEGQTGCSGIKNEDVDIEESSPYGHSTA